MGHGASCCASCRFPRLDEASAPPARRGVRHLRERRPSSYTGGAARSLSADSWTRAARHHRDNRDVAATRWGVTTGDRVAVEAPIPCGHCPTCRAGRYPMCRARPWVLPRTATCPCHIRPACGAGTPTTCTSIRASIVHRIRPDIPAALAVMFNPLGAGLSLGRSQIPDTGPGDTVLILGPGQRGLACVIAARAAGADTIIVTGLARDARKLALARALGRPITRSTSRRRTARPASRS